MVEIATRLDSSKESLRYRAHQFYLFTDTHASRENKLNFFIRKIYTAIIVIMEIYNLFSFVSVHTNTHTFVPRVWAKNHCFVIALHAVSFRKLYYHFSSGDDVSASCIFLAATSIHFFLFVSDIKIDEFFLNSQIKDEWIYLRFGKMERGLQSMSDAHGLCLQDFVPGTNNGSANDHLHNHHSLHDSVASAVSVSSAITGLMSSGNNSLNHLHHDASNQHHHHHHSVSNTPTLHEPLEKLKCKWNFKCECLLF